MALSLLPVAACGGDDLTLPGPGDPAALTILAGNDQQAPLGDTLAQPLVVQLADRDGLPVGGRDVVFRFTHDIPDAAVAPGSVPTDPNGQATVRARLGSQAGLQPIEAFVAVPGEDLRVQFTLTAVSPPAPDPPGDGGNGNGNGGNGGGNGNGGNGNGGNGNGGNGNGGN
ncbi:MAG TPA: Ig-like domain-containing protein, partial [Gemmatimonadales bacterium]|nr:Ig-like domain-containing protein [Gemmatimonadales bacterium]